MWCSLMHSVSSPYKFEYKFFHRAGLKFLKFLWTGLGVKLNGWIIARFKTESWSSEQDNEVQDQLSEGEVSSDDESTSSSSEGEVESDVNMWDNEDETPWIELPDLDFDLEFEEAKEAGDFLKLEFLLRIKEKRCDELRRRVKEEKKKEDKEKKRKLREIELRFKKLQKTESDLTKSLITASSRCSTPGQTPRTTPEGKKKSEKKKKVVSSKKKSPANGAKASQVPKQLPPTKQPHQPSAARGELDFSDIINTKKNKKFQELFEQAMGMSKNSLDFPYRDSSVGHNNRVDTSKKFEIPATGRDNSVK